MKWIVKQTRKYYNIEPTGHITQQSIVIVIIELACMHACTQASSTDFGRTFLKTTDFVNHMEIRANCCVGLVG
jgi:hypothetical protein